MDYIRELSGLGKDDVSDTGGKGASLGEMLQAGIPVPTGFVILASAFEQFLKESSLHAEIDSALHAVNHEEMHTIENASEKIKALILQAPMPKNVQQSILVAFKKLNATYVAVRSSATAEDSASAAWAGQLESYLNTTKEHIIENVKKCWASLFTPRAIFYRFEKGLHKEKVSVAVVVQKMVDSESSGIAFSVHPVTQDYNQLIIEAGFGLGEAIVSGQITPDSYVVEKKPLRMLDKKVHEQKKGLFRADHGGNVWKDLGEQGKGQVLTEEEILELAKLIMKIEQHYGFPVDVEWAREKGKFYITQSRPITTLTDKKQSSQITLQPYTYYQRCFQWKGGGLPFLFSDIFMGHYKTLECLITLSSGIWTNFLPKKVVEQTLEDGKKLISNTQAFESYRTSFEDYKKECSTFFEKIIKKHAVSREELKKLLVYFSKLFYYYSKTEFFYVDKAFEHAKTHKETAQNLEKFDAIKNKGREYLNNLFLGEKSYFEELLRILSEKFSVTTKDLKSYSSRELLDLFDSKKLSEEILEARRRAYIMLPSNGELYEIYGKEAEETIDAFLQKAHDLQQHDLKGVIANKGKAVGKVRIFSYGPEEFDKLQDMIHEMQRGEILVADTTSPELMMACKKAAAIITNQGGLMSHAAIVSRELGIPCIVGLGNITDVVKNGDTVEVDAYNGMVKIIKSK